MVNGTTPQTIMKLFLDSNHDKMIFYNLPNKIEHDSVVITIDSSIHSERELIDLYVEKLNIPYTNENWDGFRDDLCDDNPWFEDKKVVVIHNTLPDLPLNDYIIYIWIISEASRLWSNMHRVLNFFFNKNCYDRVFPLMTLEKRFYEFRSKIELYSPWTVYGIVQDIHEETVFNGLKNNVPMNRYWKAFGKCLKGLLLYASNNHIKKNKVTVSPSEICIFGSSIMYNSKTWLVKDIEIETVQSFVNPADAFLTFYLILLKWIFLTND